MKGIELCPKSCVYVHTAIISSVHISFLGIEIENTLLMKTCGEDSCVCKGYPDPNTREALLNRRVPLQRCAEACKESKLCFGIEYWDRHVDDKDDYPNCFLCPVDPSKRYTVQAVDVSKLNRRGKGKWANVYVKERKERHVEDSGNNCILIL